MGRAKLRMELIPKEKTRMTTYQKRKVGIIKKATEFTILCDVSTAMIIYPPNSNKPEIWPVNPDKFKNTIAYYKSKKGETGKRTYDLNDFFEDRKKRIEDELMKARKGNMEAKYSTSIEEFNGASEPWLRQFAYELEVKENIVRAYLESKKRNMNIQFPIMFNRPALSLTLGFGNPNHGFDHFQMMNHHFLNHNIGQFIESPSTSYIPMRRESIGLVYDNVNQQFVYAHRPMVQPQDLESQVSNGGVSDYLIDDSGRLMG